MATTEVISWHVDDVNYELIRNAERKTIFSYQRGISLPQFLTVKEAAALSLQIRRMVDRSDFVLASKGWPDKSRGI